MCAENYLAACAEHSKRLLGTHPHCPLHSFEHLPVLSAALFIEVAQYKPPPLGVSRMLKCGALLSVTPTYSVSVRGERVRQADNA